MSNAQPELPRLVRMTAHLMQSDLGELQIHAELEPPPPSEERWWWAAQVSRRVRIVGYSGGGSGSAGRFAISVDAPRGQLETIARQVRDALLEATATFAECYQADETKRAESAAAYQLGRSQQTEADQAVLDRVMNE
jgi:hypothetical protein